MNERTQRERKLWCDSEQLGDLLTKLFNALMGIEDRWKDLEPEEQFDQFILHEKILMTTQLVEWHGVRREVIGMQTIANVRLEEYYVDEPGQPQKKRVEYRYLPPIEKSAFGPTRSLSVSEGNF